jgi:phosphoketolase
MSAILDIPSQHATLSGSELHALDAYWRAANYPLLRGPLTLEHVKPRLLGHWGTTPGLNFIYAQGPTPSQHHHQQGEHR